MTRKRWLGIILLPAAALLMASPGFGAPEQFTGEFSETLVCPGQSGYSEQIYIEGSYRGLTQLVEGNEHSNWIFQVFWEADGYGLSSGAEYSLSGKWMEVIQENPPFIFLWNDHFQLIGKGQAENYEVYYKIRIVMNANGDPTVAFEDFVQCTNP